MRKLLLLVTLASFLLVGCVAQDGSLTGQVTHTAYPAFSDPESRLGVLGSLLSVSDVAVYKTAWYSVDGAAWRSFTLSGAAYASSSSWLSGSASGVLPAALSGPGEHYLIVYSCSRVSGSWDCHGNAASPSGAWQLQVITVSSPGNCANDVRDGAETGIDCGGDCIDCVEQADYYVAPNGSDSWPGTITQPWKTWSKAFHTAHPGELVYFRGGVYPTEVTDGTGIKYIPAQNLGHDGTADAPIRYFNYPGETPILDCSLSVPSSPAPSWNVWNYGIRIEKADYVHIKGLHVRNLFQRNRTDGGHDIVFALVTKYCNHIKLENMEIYNIHGVGFDLGDDLYAEIINCDSHDNNDIYAAKAGDYGMGFAAGSPENFTEGYTYFYGCRAWNNSDQGFTSPTHSRNVFDTCWAFENGDEAYPGGDGVGWKIGYWYSPQTVNDPTIIIKNSIAANNKRDGMTGNEHGFAYTSPYHLYNNFIYGNGRFGIVFNNVSDTDENELKRTLRNNIAYATGFMNVAPGGLYTHSNNSWDSSVTVADDDFVSLDVLQLYAPRKANGDLPDITFGHLRDDSDLIDRGVGVGLPYYGNAPDIGAFESSYAGTSEDGCNCSEGYYCFDGVCLLNVSGNTYFVSANGNDVNSGNFSYPWKTWGKAFHTARPGDLVYFRGGTYFTEVTDGSGIRYIPAQAGLGYDGTPENWIRYFSYPNETPVLDCAASARSPASGSWNVYNYGIYLSGVDYVHIKGLQLKNVKQTGDYVTDLCIGFHSDHSDHLKLENMAVSKVGGQAFSNLEAYYLEVINCDAYDNGDYYGAVPEHLGMWSTGFGGGSTEFENGYEYYYGCRAWNNSDQGFSYADSRGEVITENCWSFDNGALYGDGLGWKIGYFDYTTATPLVIKITNCISANNNHSVNSDGFSGNEHSDTFTVPMNIYNNFAYNSGRCGFIFYNTASSDAVELSRTLRNNIAYVAGGGPLCLGSTALYTHSNNSWDSSPAVVVSAEDFESLDVSQLYRPRKPNGDLPDITFGRLKEGSDLIDRGVAVGIPFEGTAPDIGAYEHMG